VIGMPLTIDRRALVFGPAGRRVPWLAMGATGAGCAAIVWWRASVVESNVEVVQLLRLAAVVLAASAATCLEDSCETLTMTTAVGRLRRRALTLGMTGVVVVTIWLGVTFVAAGLAVEPASDRPLPVAGLLVELIALVTCGWFIAAAIIAQLGWRGSAMRAAVSVVVAAICTLRHPQLYEWLWAVPNLSPNLAAGQVRWITIATVAIAATMVLSVDPASRRVARRCSL
jgi:hypothetical protein